MRAIVRSSASAGLIIESGIGQVSGQWYELSSTPRAGQRLDVEIDIDWVARGAEVVSAEGITASLQIESEANIIVSFIESLDEDNMGHLRLTPDCIVMVETDGLLAPENCVQMQVSSSFTGIFGGIVPD